MRGAGAVAACGLWTYQPLKLTPLLIVLWLLWIRRTDRAHFDRLARTLRWLIGGYAVVALPMLVVAVTEPVAYFGRSLQTSPLNPDNGGGFGIGHLLHVAGMFTVAGDPNPRHNAGALPMLGWPLGLVALAGVRRAWRARATVPAASLLLIGGAVFLIPPTLAVEGGAPHFLRSVGMAPFVAGMVGMGCVELRALGSRLGGVLAAHAATGAAVTVLVGTTAYGISTYVQRPPIQWWYAYSGDTAQMARAASPNDTVISDDYSALTVRFLDHDRLPNIAPPSVILHPAAGTAVYARTRQELTAALGADMAASATVAGRDPSGAPDIYVVRA